MILAAMLHMCPSAERGSGGVTERRAACRRQHMRQLCLPGCIVREISVRLWRLAYEDCFSPLYCFCCVAFFYLYFLPSFYGLATTSLQLARAEGQ